jgi:hypothetical protein
MSNSNRSRGIHKTESTKDGSHHVSFGTVEVREYARILKNPAHPTVPMCLSMGWTYQQHKPIGLELCRKVGLPRRTTITERFVILYHAGFSPNEINEAEEQQNPRQRPFIAKSANKLKATLRRMVKYVHLSGKQPKKPCSENQSEPCSDRKPKPCIRVWSMMRAVAPC